MYVLITVPHGFCIRHDKAERMCDTRAESCAKILAKLLKQREIEHKIISIHVPRKLVDVNRDKPTMNPLAIKEWTRYNNRITATIMDKKVQPILFIDVHSFPKGSFGNAQIAILDIFHKRRPELETLVEQVKRDLNINIKLLKGGENYIQNQYQADAYPLLIEFCEDREYLSTKAVKDFFELLMGVKPPHPPL